MSSFVKKLMATGAALTIGFSSFAVADYSYNMNNNNCFAQPACDPCASWCDNISFNAAWLYWKAAGDDFQYAVDKTTLTTGTVGAVPIQVSNEKFHDISFDLKSGFRIGAGFDLPSTGWGVYVDWTHYHASHSSSTSVVGGLTPASTTAIALPVFADFSSILASGDVVDFAGGVRTRYDTVDIEFGKWLNCGCSSLMFRPHAGFRVADIQERFRTGYTSSVALDGFPSVAFQHENHFKGFGVRAGLDTDFQLCQGFSFIGRGAASAIWGNTRLRNTSVLGSATTAGVFTSNIRENFHQTRFITDLSFGLRWKTMACGCYPLMIELAWEHHYLFNQHRYWVDDEFDSTDATSSWRSTGDMSLQGLTLNVGVDF